MLLQRMVAILAAAETKGWARAAAAAAEREDTLVAVVVGGAAIIPELEDTFHSVASASCPPSCP